MSRRRSCPQAIDRTPLFGPDRWTFEQTLLKHPGIKKTARAVLRELLSSWLWGRADCYPSAEAIVRATGYGIATVKRALAYLEKIGVIVRVIDRSILPSQRRIILVSHPNAAAILAELRANSYVEFVGDPAKEAPRQGRLPMMGVGVSKTLGAGVSKMPPSRVRVPVSVEAVDSEPVAERVENSPGLNGNGCLLETDTQPQAQPAAPAPAIAPVLTKQGVDAAMMATLTAKFAIDQATRHQPMPPAPAPCMQAIDGRPLTALQVELLAMFTPEMRSQFDQAPAEMRAEILRTFKSGIIAPGAFDMVRIKLANLGAYTPAAAVLAEVLGSPAVTQAPVATQAAAVPVMASGPLDDDRALYEALRSLSPGTPKIEVQRIALRLTVLLEDRHSYPFWVGVVRDARQGVLPVDLIINGLEKRKDPAVDSPARVATAMVSKFRGQRASKFQAPRRQPCPRA